MNKHAESSAGFYDQAQFTTNVSIAVNTILGVIKLAIGLWGNSLAMIADAMHTLSDVIASLAVWVGLKIARQPADEAHPYGHGKAEAISGKIVAIALFVIGVWIACKGGAGVLAFFMGGSGAYLEPPRAMVLYAALLSIVVKEMNYQYQVRVGKRVGSVALIADAWHHRSDSFSSVGVAIGIAAAMLGGPKWHWADEAAALVVAILIIYMSWSVFKKAAAGLMDAQSPEAVRERIKAVARGVEGVKDVEKLFARQSGLDLLVDIHVEVDGDMTVREGHRIATEVKGKLMRDIPQVTHALVHVEPYYPGDH
jgi:cation diffusion facilitator family transporter